MNNIKISCVIPTCDRDNLLNETLKSVFNQSSLPDEIIVVNNGKNNLKINNDKNYNLKIYNIIKYAGVSQALNFGVSMASGEYIAFIEDDDLWSKDYIYNIREAINPKFTAYISRIDKLQNNIVKPYKNAKNKINVSNLLTYNPGINISNLCLLKEAIIKIGGFDPFIKVGADRAMVLQLLLTNNNFLVLENNQEICRFHNDTRLSRNYYNLIKSHFYFYLKFRKIMKFKHKIVIIYKILFLFIFRRI